MEGHPTLKSGLASTLVAVLITGGLGGWITQCYQDRAAKAEFERQILGQEHELNKIWLQKRGDEALDSRKKYLDARQLFVEQIFEEIASTVLATDQIIDVTTERWKLAGLTGHVLEEKRTRRKALVDEFNNAETTWRMNLGKNGIKVIYFSTGAPGISDRWSDLSGSLDVLLECANTTYTQWNTAVVQRASYKYTADACRSEKLAVTAASDELAHVMMSDVNYGWVGWESPQRMRQELGIAVSSE
ncbi:MAG: hypothetical protein KY459_11925 [Acidobacteria bacterium]|nr:hypothetical protein [Acidobacteriota bacterium]